MWINQDYVFIIIIIIYYGQSGCRWMCLCRCLLVCVLVSGNVVCYAPWARLSDSFLIHLLTEKPRKTGSSVKCRAAGNLISPNLNCFFHLIQSIIEEYGRTRINTVSFLLWMETMETNPWGFFSIFSPPEGNRYRKRNYIFIVVAFCRSFTFLPLHCYNGSLW